MQKYICMAGASEEFLIQLSVHLTSWCESRDTWVMIANKSDSSDTRSLNKLLQSCPESLPEVAMTHYTSVVKDACMDTGLG